MKGAKFANTSEGEGALPFAIDRHLNCLFLHIVVNITPHV